MSWALSDIRTKWRSLTGRSTTGDIADASVNTLINEYYQYDFPVQVGLNRLDDTWSQQLLATDSGEYSMSEDIIELKEPVILNGYDELQVFYDQGEFWRRYKPEEDFVSAPTLAVGSSNAAHVANSAFYYTYNEHQYYKAAAETALSGDAVPQNKYGAWLLTIDDDGTITITEAGNNDTGYDTAGLAVAGLVATSSSDAVMGYVTAICTAGALTPGTTELNDGASVTATFTDGDPGLRGRPESLLLARNIGKIYVRPKPDDLYYATAQAALERPSALSADTSTPLDEAWGLALALGSAAKWLASKEGDSQRLSELIHGIDGTGMTPGCLDYEITVIRRKQTIQQKPVVVRSW